MAQTYIRQSSFADGDTITAALFNNEYNQLVNAFSYSSTSDSTTGHRHDGTAGQGGNIYRIGDLDFFNKIEIDTTNNRIGLYVQVSSGAVEQIRLQDGALLPVTDSDIDLGTTSLRFKDTYTDTITTTGNVAVGGNLTVTGTATIAGNLTFGDAASDTVAFSADVASNLLPSVDNNFDLGASGSEWKDLYIDGVAYVDAINFNGTAITATAAELNILDGVTSTAAELNILDGVTSTAAELNILDGVTASAADINLIDGITNGTVIASKAIITDSNKDITGGRNITISGELDAATLDISGDADIDGTLEADAITIGGVTLAETISDTVGAMVTSNTESGITVAYQDADNTLDFTIGTLNQNTTGNSATATALETARTIHGVSFDGTGNIDLSEVVQDTVGAMFTSNSETGIVAAYQDSDGTIDLAVGTLNQDTTGLAATATALATARTIHGVSFDGTANIDLTEVVQDTVGAMVSSNTESGITVAYQDGDGTLDFTVGTLNQNTTGSAATLTTARTIGGVSFDGSANINLPGVNAAGNQDTTGNAATATLATTTTVTDSTANTNFPVVFHNESNGLLDDTGALRYNPSTGELLVPKLTVAGTTTQVDTVTMEASNAIIFEGATADAHETTLSVIDPTADRTISLPNATGTLSLITGTETLTNKTLTAPTLTGTTVVASLDISGNIDVDGTTNLDVVDIDGAVDMASTLAVGGVVTVIDGSTSAPSVTNAGDTNTGIYFPADDNFGIVVGGSRKLLANSSGVSINNGVLDADGGITVDNITIDGTEIDLSSGDLTIDVAGDINLDADGGNVMFKDGGTEIGLLANTSTNFVIMSRVDDKDIIFKGKDNGSTITALTLDMSAAGTATFNHDVILGDDGKAIFGAGSDLQIYHDGSDSYIKEDGTGNLIIAADDFRVTNVAVSETMISADTDGTVSLYHNGSAKIATTSTGIDVTGTVVSDSLTVDTTTLVVDASNNRVGIGTTSPSVDLETVGSTGIKTGNGSGTGLFKADGGSTKIGSFSNHRFDLVTNNTVRASIDTSGNVGIGTTSPTYSLDVQSSATTGIVAMFSNEANQTSEEALIWIAGQNKTNYGVMLGAVPEVDTPNVQDHAFIVKTNDSTGTDHTERFRVSSDGNVGIGTDSPAKNLHISNATNPTIRITDTTNSVNLELLSGNSEAYLGTQSNHPVLFTTNNTEKMRVDTSGNVLVGTTDSTPYNNNAGSTADNGIVLSEAGWLAAARYQGTVAFLNRTDNDGDIAVFRKDGTTVGSIGVIHGNNLFIGGVSHSGLQFGTSVIYPTATAGAANDGVVDLGASSNRFKDLHLSGTAGVNALDIKSGSTIHGTITTSSSSLTLNARNTAIMLFQAGGAERMRIDASGNLIVGGTSVGASNSAGIDSSGIMTISRASGTGRNMHVFTNGGSGVGTITTSASATQYNTSSDARLKDVTGSARGLEVINELNPVAYNWKADGKADEGLIAQEVKDIVPNAVSGSEEDMYQMDYSKLVTPLIKAVQEQQELITTLQAEVALLKEK